MGTTGMGRARAEFVDGLVQFNNRFRATELQGLAMTRSLDAV